MVAENVYFQAQIGECTEFVCDGKKQRASIIVAPLKVYSNEDLVKVINGCNLWKACTNLNCQYSLNSHPPLKE